MIDVTTDAVPARDRADFWADLVSRNVTPIQVEPRGPHALRGSIRARDIGGLGVARVSGRGVRALHTRAHIASATDHVYAVGVHLGGDAAIIQRGETRVLRPGDLFVTDSRQAFHFDLHRPWRHLLLTVPTRWLEPRVARPESLAGAILRGQPLARLWAWHLSAGFALGADLSPAAAAVFARHSLELLGQLFDESYVVDGAPSDAAHEAMHTAACHVIALGYANPDLTPSAIARDVGVSTRTLSRVFARRGDTIMRRVYDERVRQAARLLTAPESANRSITEIAFACGFNDLSHFGRVFANRMHMTPSQWRRQAR